MSEPFKSSLDYFKLPERVAALATACQSWIGTPFRDRSCVKGAGGGVDCVGFVGAVLLEIGAIDQKISVPPYTFNHAEHSDESLLKAWFDQPEVRARVRPLDEEEPHLDGDFVFPRVGRTEHHLGLRIGQDVFHVVRGAGVCVMTVTQCKLHRSRYRLIRGDFIEGGYTGDMPHIVPVGPQDYALPVELVQKFAGHVFGPKDNTPLGSPVCGYAEAMERGDRKWTNVHSYPGLPFIPAEVAR